MNKGDPYDMKIQGALLALFLLTTPLMNAGELGPGDAAVGFALTDARSGRTVAFEPGDGPAVVIFTCNQCPYAQAFEQRIIDLGKTYQRKGVDFYAVNPNDEAEYAVESMEGMRKRADEKDYPFPYLKDADSSVARSYGARVTPHVFVVDGKGTVRYNGYVDDSARPAERTHEGLVDALDAVLAGRPVEKANTKAFGCTIKWNQTR